MICTYCKEPVAMHRLTEVSGFPYCPECVPKPNDPIVDTAIGLLEKGIEALKRNNRYNKGLNFKDYLTSGLQTSVDRVVEPLLRVHASGSYDQAVDCPAYAALHCAWVLAGCPESKILINVPDIFITGMGEAPKKFLNNEIYNVQYQLPVEAQLCPDCHRMDLVRVSSVTIDGVLSTVYPDGSLFCRLCRYLAKPPQDHSFTAKPTGCGGNAAPIPHSHDFSSKLTGDTE
jgi:hypothetical protein